MKRCERKRRPYRGCKKTDQRSGRLLWHRMLAVLVAAVTILTGIELSGLEAVFAKETSGYQIDVSYSEGKAQAVLKGNTDSVGAGITLGELKDEEGNTFDPSEFETTVTENGTYTYILTYKETASQNGKQMDKEEKVTVTVDQIETKTSETSSVSAANEAAASQQPAASEETPAALPLNVLEESLEGIQAARATTTAAINVGQYADELLISNLNTSGTYTFEGGSFDTVEIPSFEQTITGTGTTVQRSFSRAGIIIAGGDESAPVFITGLYPIEKSDGTGYDWYYTTEDNTEQGNPYGNIEAGYLLDTDTTSVRFYYALDTSDTYRIGFLPSSIDFSLLVNGTSYEGAGDLVDPIQVKPGEKIVATIELPSEYQTALMALYEFDAGWSDSFTRVIASYGLVRPEDDDAIAKDKSNGTWIANAEQIASTTSTLRYQVIFEMPAQDIDIRMHNFGWDTNLETRYYGLWINEGMPVQNTEMGITRLFTRFVEGPGDSVNTNSDSALLAGTGVATKHWATNPTYTPYTQPGSEWGNSGFGQITGGGGTYIHVDAYTWPYSATSSNTPTQMRQMKYGNLTDRTDLSDDINQGTYLNPEDTSKTTVATGNFYPGESVGFRLETARGARNYNSAQGHPLAWRYMPGYLTVDIYAGKGQSFTEGKNFERYYVDLSSLNQRGITRTSLGGNGEILIQCLQKDINNWTSDWRGSFNRYNLTGNVGVPVSAYNITVNGVTRPFKIIYNHYSSVQENYRVSSMTGVEDGTLATSGIGNASNVNGSYIYLKKDQNSARQGYYPLTEEYFFIRAEQPNGGFKIGLKPSEGYSVPTITTKKADGTVITSGSNGYSLSAPTLENGRYVYTLSLSGSATAELRTMDIVAAPVSFGVEYWYNNKRYDSANLTLAYDQTENALIGLNVPANISAGNFFSGFKLTVEGGSKTITIDPTSGGNWQPGDIINVRSIYQQMSEQGALSNSTNYTIKLTAQTSTTGGVWLNAGYTVYKQSGWFSGTEYNNTNFADRESGSVSGLAGGSVLFTGYKDQFPDGTNKYLLDEGKSTFSGSMPTSTDQNGTEIGKFYYLNAATVQIYVPTDLTDINAETTNINKWNTDNANVYYTGVQGKSNVVDLSSIMLPAEANGKELQGWRIVKGSTTTGTSEQIQVYNYEISAGASSTLDLNTLGTTVGDAANAGRAAWEAIFGKGASPDRTNGSGTITLIPYYVDGTKPIRSPDGGTSQTVKFYRDNSFSVTFVMEGEVTASNALAQYAVYRSQAEESGTPLRSVAVGTVDLFSKTSTKVVSDSYYPVLKDGNVTINQTYDAEAKQTTITLTLTNINEQGTDRTYRVYLWNQANGPLTTPNGALSNAGWRDGPPASLTSGSYQYIDTQVYRVPQVYNQSADTTVTVDEKALFYENQGIKVTGTFKLEGDDNDSSPNTNNKESIQALLKEAAFSGDLKVALYKKNPNTASWENQNYQLFGMVTTSDQDSDSDGFLDLSITDLKNTIDRNSVRIEPVEGSNKSFTISFTKTGNVTHNNDDGAQYLIFAWTDTNNTNPPANWGTTTDVDGNTDLNSIGIPGVKTTMTGILGSQIKSMISFPQKVTMSDSADRYIYSSNEKITLEPIADAELPDPDPGVDVTILDLSSSQTFDISRNNNSETIALKAFTGTRDKSGSDISENGGKVGTMKFSTGSGSTQNTLPLYFKSENMVTGIVNGDPFTGRITFQFSKAAGN